MGQVRENRIRVRLPHSADFMGAESSHDGSGRVYSGPMTVGFAATAMLFLVMAALGSDVIRVLGDLGYRVSSTGKHVRHAGTRCFPWLSGVAFQPVSTMNILACWASRRSALIGAYLSEL
jgi:hypothetical protein